MSCREENDRPGRPSRRRRRTVGGKRLKFQAADPEADNLVDLEAHSIWTAYGVCVEGPMKGTRLKPLILEPEFWFAWSEFHPQTPSVRMGIRALTFDPQRGRDLRAAI